MHKMSYVYKTTESYSVKIIYLYLWPAIIDTDLPHHA